MKNNMVKIQGFTKNMFEDAMQIQNINYEIHKDFLSDSNNDNNSFGNNIGPLILTDRNSAKQRRFLKWREMLVKLFTLFY